MSFSKKVNDLKSQESIKKAGGIFEEFKTFISRGNVMDLAVGVIVGGAFTSIVNSLVGDILMPIIGTVLVGINFKKLGFTIPWGNNPYINVGSFLESVITFLITAACVFIIVKGINSINKKKTEEKPEEKKEEVQELSKEVELLTEIRDLLSKDK
ncbi:large conductance mechanosensitive channel protein MscL [Candidatus Galacturonibacter soehngenii]|uniref:large conductance mechanosensitive channel protein MscL n=1 Tax=Candidatus Galacturonatibacter soehngenii TaxID=2307010 RepID=UPI00242F4CBC|nr:large conductance mechanosensitive channel protein MscL [Candidatus Galacturonibacter soehngenii]